MSIAGNILQNPTKLNYIPNLYKEREYKYFPVRGFSLLGANTEELTDLLPLTRDPALFLPSHNVVCCSVLLEFLFFLFLSFHFPHSTLRAPPPTLHGPCMAAESAGLARGDNDQDDAIFHLRRKERRNEGWLATPVSEKEVWHLLNFPYRVNLPYLPKNF